MAKLGAGIAVVMQNNWIEPVPVSFVLLVLGIDPPPSLEFVSAKAHMNEKGKGWKVYMEGMPHIGKT